MVAETMTVGSHLARAFPFPLPSKWVVCPRGTFHPRFAAGQGHACPAGAGQKDAMGCSSEDAEPSHGVSRHGTAVLGGRLSRRRPSLRSGHMLCFNLCFFLVPTYFTLSF